MVHEDWSFTEGGVPTAINGFDTAYRLREGIERFFITDINNPAGSALAQSEIAIMFDQMSDKVDEFNHVPGGCNVLYMDGHVEFIKYPGKFPVSSRMADTTRHWNAGMH